MIRALSTAERLQIAEREVLEDEPQTTVCAPPLVVHGPILEPTTEQCLRAIEVSGTVDFWDRPEEDLYTDSDGEQV